MPPAALHHFEKPSAASKNSCSSPGAAVLPGSASTPMRISVLLIPRPVGPLGVPGPQMAFSVPKSPLPGAAELDALLAGLLLDGVPALPPPDEDRPQPAVTSPSTATALTAAIRVNG